MVYMSYFGNPFLRSIDANLQVAISLKVPADFRGSHHFKDLAPAWSTLQSYKVNGDYLEYVKDYCKTRLSRLDVAHVAQELDGKIILCYEKPGPNVFCHRLIVQKWLWKNGYECKEIR